MSEAARAIPDGALAPQPGQQWAFHASRAEIVFYGGAAFGGKSWSLVFEGARNVKVKGYDAIIFRRTSPELTGGGSIWEEAHKIYPLFGGRPRENSLDWTFPTGDPRRPARIEFSHLQKESDKYAHKSKRYAYIGFDELTSFTEGQFWYLYARAGSVSEVRPYVRGATNPDPDSWVRKMVDWWIDAEGYPIRERSGVIRWLVRDGDDIVWGTRKELLSRFPEKKPISFTFIPADIDDNPIGTSADPDYRSKLDMLPRVERERQLKSNWNVRSAAGLYFQRSYFEVIGPDDMPAQLVSRCRAWDRASSRPRPGYPDPDWTAGARWSRCRNGVYYIEHIERFRESSGKTEQRILNIAKSDSKKVPIFLWQDPGGDGLAMVEHYQRRVLNGFRTTKKPSREDKVEYAGPWSSQAEAGNVKVLRGAWNEPFFNEGEAFPTKGVHDDQIDGCSGAYIATTKSGLSSLRNLAKF